jgi:Fic family protein
MIFRTLELSDDDTTVLAAIHTKRRELANVLRVPRRWQGGLRRAMLARAIQGSNSIEGYAVAEDDAAAALGDEEPLSADAQTFAEIRGYRLALGYVLQMANDPHFAINATSLRGMHYMMLSHDLGKSPGQYRAGPVYVYDDRTERTVYEGPDARLVPGLMEELTASLTNPSEPGDPLVRAAMGHLNLVMIHPFRDGNGRMARALQTLVLAREAIVEPAFSSIEEWLGQNTDDYYRVLAATGHGAWNPDRDTRLWVRFNLRAHHMQAATVARRAAEAMTVWDALDRIVGSASLPDRVTDLLYEAYLGYRLRRSSYVRSAGIDERTATRDLGRLVDADLLRPSGATRARTYVAGGELATLRDEIRKGRQPIEDPYPDFTSTLPRATLA